MCIEQIAPEALKLPARERALLAASLWESIGNPFQPKTADRCAPRPKTEDLSKQRAEPVAATERGEIEQLASFQTHRSISNRHSAGIANHGAQRKAGTFLRKVRRWARRFHPSIFKPPRIAAPSVERSKFPVECWKLRVRSHWKGNFQH